MKKETLDTMRQIFNGKSIGCLWWARVMFSCPIKEIFLVTKKPAKAIIGEATVGQKGSVCHTVGNKLSL